MTQQEFVRLLLEAIEKRKDNTKSGDGVFVKDSTDVLWTVRHLTVDKEGDIVIYVM